MRRVDNPKNRFELAEVVFDEGCAPLAGLRVHEERVKTVLSENRSPDLPFRYSVNPYRGCQHACAYCYARPSHQYWGLGSGTDFEREIIVKVNAVERLREAFVRRGWRREEIAFSGNTDCYQPLEGRYRLTRALLETCAEHRNPVAIVTKSALVTRDIDVLQTLSRTASVSVFVSIPFADEDDARAIEPGAAAVHRRFETLEALSAAGIATGVAVAPVIPGLGDRQIATVLRRAREAGASRAFMMALRLPPEVEPVFVSRLREARPHAAAKVIAAVKEMRGGRMNDSRFGARMSGEGPRWRAVEDLFRLHVSKLGFEAAERPAPSANAPTAHAQLELFSGPKTPPS